MATAAASAESMARRVTGGHLVPGRPSRRRGGHYDGPTDGRRPIAPPRAFFGRYLISLVAATAVMVGMVVVVNRTINDKIESVPRIDLRTATPPPEGGNYLLDRIGLPAGPHQRPGPAGVRRPDPGPTWRDSDPTRSW